MKQGCKVLKSREMAEGGHERRRKSESMYITDGL